MVLVLSFHPGLVEATQIPWPNQLDQLTFTSGLVVKERRVETSCRIQPSSLNCLPCHRQYPPVSLKSEKTSLPLDLDVHIPINDPTTSSRNTPNYAPSLWLIFRVNFILLLHIYKPFINTPYSLKCPNITLLIPKKCRSHVNLTNNREVITS